LKLDLNAQRTNFSPFLLFQKNPCLLLIWQLLKRKFLGTHIQIMLGTIFLNRRINQLTVMKRKLSGIYRKQIKTINLSRLMIKKKNLLFQAWKRKSLFQKWRYIVIQFLKVKYWHLKSLRDSYLELQILSLLRQSILT